jgi:phage head maturation protease
MRVAGAFERVLDQRSDILLVFNHEDPGHPSHRLPAYGSPVSTG